MHEVVCPYTLSSRSSQCINNNVWQNSDHYVLQVRVTSRRTMWTMSSCVGVLLASPDISARTRTVIFSVSMAATAQSVLVSWAYFIDAVNIFYYRLIWLELAFFLNNSTHFTIKHGAYFTGLSHLMPRFLCPRHSKNGGGALSVTPVRPCVHASVRASVTKFVVRSITFERLHRFNSNLVC